jgi:hypothetical protein
MWALNSKIHNELDLIRFLTFSTKSIELDKMFHFFLDPKSLEFERVIKCVIESSPKFTER